jgi:hypothetical protein
MMGSVVPRAWVELVSLLEGQLGFNWGCKPMTSSSGEHFSCGRAKHMGNRARVASRAAMLNRECGKDTKQQIAEVEQQSVEIEQEICTGQTVNYVLENF